MPSLAKNLFSITMALGFSLIYLGCPGEVGRNSKWEKPADGSLTQETDEDGGGGFIPQQYDGASGPFYDDSGKVNTSGDGGVGPKSDLRSAIDVVITNKTNGCYIQQTICSKYPEFAKAEKFLDEAGMANGAGTDRDYCRQRAAEYSVYCGNDLLADLPTTTATFEVNGAVVAQKRYKPGNACQVCFSDCPNDKVFWESMPKITKDGKTTGCTYDYYGYTHGGESDLNTTYCHKRIKDYFDYCAKTGVKFWVWGQHYLAWVTAGDPQYYEQ